MASIAQNYTYTPPKWLADLKSIYPNEEFSITKKYFLGLLIVPAIVLVISIVIMLSYQIAICCRCCCPIKFKGYHVQTKEFLEGDFKTRAKYYKYTLISFAIWWIIALISTFFMTWPYQNLSQGFSSTNTSILLIILIFEAIMDVGKVALKGLILLSNAIHEEPCYTAYKLAGNSIQQQIIDKSSLIISSINDLIAYVDRIPRMLHKASETLTFTISPVVTAIFWWYFGIMLIILFLWLLIFIFQSKKYLTFMTILTQVIILILVIIYCVELFVAHLNSSFCLPTPTHNVLNQFTPSDSTYDLIKYYTNCNGKNICMSV